MARARRASAWAPRPRACTRRASRPERARPLPRPPPQDPSAPAPPPTAAAARVDVRRAAPAELPATPFASATEADIAADASALCTSCGACCAYSAEWPRFSLEDDAALALIPAEFVDDDHGRMRCEGDRCSALVGVVGTSTACGVYAVRPDVCRDCMPGDEACQIARRHHGL